MSGEAATSAVESSGSELRQQVGQLLSKENLERKQDVVLSSLLRSYGFQISADALAAHPSLKVLGVTGDQLLAAVGEAPLPGVGVVPNSRKVQINIKPERNVIGLRDVPDVVTQNDVIELFRKYTESENGAAGQEVPVPGTSVEAGGHPQPEQDGAVAPEPALDLPEFVLDVRRVVNGHFYVTLRDEAITTDVALWLRGQKLKDQSVLCYVKSTSVVPTNFLMTEDTDPLPASDTSSARRFLNGGNENNRLGVTRGRYRGRGTFRGRGRGSSIAHAGRGGYQGYATGRGWKSYRGRLSRGAYKGSRGKYNYPGGGGRYQQQQVYYTYPAGGVGVAPPTYIQQVEGSGDAIAACSVTEMQRAFLEGEPCEFCKHVQGLRDAGTSWARSEGAEPATTAAAPAAEQSLKVPIKQENGPLVVEGAHHAKAYVTGASAATTVGTKSDATLGDRTPAAVNQDALALLPPCPGPSLCSYATAASAYAAPSGQVCCCCGVCAQPVMPWILSGGSAGVPAGRRPVAAACVCGGSVVSAAGAASEPRAATDAAAAAATHGAVMQSGAWHQREGADLSVHQTVAGSAVEDSHKSVANDERADVPRNYSERSFGGGDGQVSARGRRRGYRRGRGVTSGDFAEQNQDRGSGSAPERSEGFRRRTRGGRGGRPRLGINAGPTQGWRRSSKSSAGARAAKSENREKVVVITAADFPSLPVAVPTAPSNLLALDGVSPASVKQSAPNVTTVRTFQEVREICEEMKHNGTVTPPAVVTASTQPLQEGKAYPVGASGTGPAGRGVVSPQGSGAGVLFNADGPNQFLWTHELVQNSATADSIIYPPHQKSFLSATTQGAFVADQSFPPIGQLANSSVPFATDTNTVSPVGQDVPIAAVAAAPAPAVTFPSTGYANVLGIAGHNVVASSLLPASYAASSPAGRVSSNVQWDSAQLPGGVQYPASTVSAAGSAPPQGITAGDSTLNFSEVAANRSFAFDAASLVGIPSEDVGVIVPNDNAPKLKIKFGL